MQEDIGLEEMLSLNLGISSTAKKRKRTEESNVIPCGNLMPDVLDKKFFGLLQSRERMLGLDPRRKGLEDGEGLQLIHLLLASAAAVDANNTISAIDALHELYQLVSTNGDPIQRVAAYFADGLAARLLTKTSPFYETIMAQPASEEQLLAFTELYQASPFHQFAHFTANQAIMEAFEEGQQRPHNGRSLHVIDFDVSYGFQWPSLIQSLSDKATRSKPISLRITGFGRSIEELRETETRLVNFTKGCDNLFMKFEGLLRGSVRSDFKIEKNATLVVNLVFYLQTLRSSSEVSDALMAVCSLNPSLVVVVEKEGGRRPCTFLSRFMESLHYYAAMFDSLNDCLPAESTERLKIEKNHLGREIKIAMTEEEKEEGKHLEFERTDTWKGKMESFGFGEIKLSSRSVSQAKLLLKIKSHLSTIEHDGGCGFRILERDEGRAISLAWQDRHLATVSAWHCVRSPNHSLGCSS
ncbi:GRAS family protein RAM1-like [Phoenix dactylifera]|uniref:GRAS family protein RAM1-like n=1 Tax=Phoenix dactylifera TaxID=42345 RepID=A0A8B7BMP2_PHODC|nr:GRAS family protein RAM1-like [Phoenix dactylifera]